MIQGTAGKHQVTTPTTDDQVFTHDGKRLGIVTDQTESHFKVHVRLRRDYWLNRELIRMREPGRLTLHISRDVVNNYKVRMPGAQPATRPVRP